VGASRLLNSIKMRDKADPALAQIRLQRVTSLHLLDKLKSSSPLRLFPPYPLPLTRCIQAKSSPVRSMKMTTSVTGMQQHGKSLIGAIAERLAIPYPVGIHGCVTVCETSSTFAPQLDPLAMLATAKYRVHHP
jgi:hypothetical protein